MKAAMFRGPQDLSVIDFELPKIKEDEILIKVLPVLLVAQMPRYLITVIQDLLHLKLLVMKSLEK